MSTLGTLALSGSEAAFFALPPRPPRGTRPDGRRAHALGRLVRVIRRELADATAGSRTDAVPRLRNYPY